jgi:cell filamentation protein
MEWDDYFYSGTNVLRNKVSIKNQRKLNQFEKSVTQIRDDELSTNPVQGHFDFEHLKNIHKHLFQDVYDWAGEIRDVNMGKGKFFTNPNEIEKQAQSIFNNLKEKNYLKNLNQDDFIKEVTKVFSEINSLHPFREGNGRAQRIFIKQLAEKADHKLDFSSITKERMLQASIESHENNPSKMERIFDEIISPEKVALANRFNDFLKQEKGLDSWNDLYISVAKEGQEYDGTFVGSDTHSFTMMLPNENSIVIGDKCCLKKDLKSGDHLKIKIPEKEQNLSINLEQSYQKLLSDMVDKKNIQLENLENRIQALIKRQTSKIQQIKRDQPGFFSMKNSKKSYQETFSKQQSRLVTLNDRLDVIKEIKESMALHSTKIEKLAGDKLRYQKPTLVKKWESMRAEQRLAREDLRKKEQKRKHEQKVRSKTKSIKR